VKYKHCDGYQKFVSSLGIPNFEFYIGRTSQELKTRSFTGPEKLKVFRNIKIEALLPNFDSTECARIQNLWTGLLELNMLFSKPAEHYHHWQLTSLNKVQSRGFVTSLMSTIMTT